MNVRLSKSVNGQQGPVYWWLSSSSNRSISTSRCPFRKVALPQHHSAVCISMHACSIGMLRKLWNANLVNAGNHSIIVFQHVLTKICFCVSFSLDILSTLSRQNALTTTKRHTCRTSRLHILPISGFQTSDSWCRTQRSKYRKHFFTDPFDNLQRWRICTRPSFTGYPTTQDPPSEHARLQRNK